MDEKSNEDKFLEAIPIVATIDVTEYGCTKCKHIWIPRVALAPVICPKCQTRGHIVRIKK